MLKTTSAQIVPSSLHCLVDDHVSTKQKIPKFAKTIQNPNMKPASCSTFLEASNPLDVNLRPVLVDQ